MVGGVLVDDDIVCWIKVGLLLLFVDLCIVDV